MKQDGFTMIELLVVIAIIAILAAIIFPAVVSAKDAAYRSSDMSHLNEIRTALQLYRTDQGAYPPELFGYVEPYGNVITLGQTAPVPADQIQGYLFPKRVPAISTFQPAYVHAAATATVGGLLDTSKIGSGTDQINSACGTTGTLTGPLRPTAFIGPGRRFPAPSPRATIWGRYSRRNLPNEHAVLRCGCPGQLQRCSLINSVPQFYTVDGYDVAAEPDSNGDTRYVIHYALFWTGLGLGVCTDVPCPGGPSGSSADSMKQLGYSNPPDNTVITWDSYFRNYTPAHTPELGVKRDVVLFLGGNAKMYDSNAVYQNAWNISP